MKLCLIYVSIVTSFVMLSGHPTFRTGRDPLFRNSREMQPPPLYWTITKTPGIGHTSQDYYYTDRIPKSQQIRVESLPPVQHYAPSYNRSLLKPTTTFQDKTFKNEKLPQLRSKLESELLNKYHVTTSGKPKNETKISSSKNYLVFVWLPASDPIPTEASTQSTNDSNSYAIVPEEGSNKFLDDGTTTSDTLNVRDRKRSPRVYSIGRGLSSYLSIGNGDILPMFIFDVPNKCPLGYQLDSQGSCRPIFSFEDSIYNKDSMYSSPAKPSLASKQNNTIPNNWSTTISSAVEELTDKPLEEVKPTDVIVIGTNDSSNQPEDLPTDLWETVTTEIINGSFINGNASLENMSTISLGNFTNENKPVADSTQTGQVVDTVSNTTISDGTSSEDFFFDFTEFKMNDNDSSLRNQEEDSTSVLDYLNVTDLSINKNEETWQY